MSLAERVDPERAWAGAVATLALALAAGTAFAPRVVWDRFLWHYFWGPVVADANGVGVDGCAAMLGGSVSFYSSAEACAAAASEGAIIARPGYTLVSEVGYAVTLLLALVGVILLLRRLGLGERPEFFFALLPYMFLGGALRVVEDANDAVPPGVEPAITYPWNTLIISPVIYFTVFFITLGALVVSVRLARTGWVDRYRTPLAGIGIAALALTLGYLLVLALTTDYVAFYPQVTLVVLAGTTVITAAVWWLLERYAPAVNAGTGAVGAVVLWGHAVDGVANVLMTDWLGAIGVPGEYFPKHPLNEVLVAAATAVVPASVLAVIGDAWPFLLVKIVAATLVVYVFDERIFEESPRYAILLLVAIVAVGLGPGTRDMLRATFGI